MNKNCIDCNEIFIKKHNNDIVCNNCIDKYQEKKDFNLEIKTNRLKVEQLDRLESKKNLDKCNQIYLSLTNEDKIEFLKLIDYKN